MSEQMSGPSPEPNPRNDRALTRSTRRVAILGASVAGLRAALTLDRLLLGRRDHEIVVVDRNDYHQVGARIPAVAAGVIPAQAATVPIRKLLGARAIRFLQARVESVDSQAGIVRTSEGTLDYRWLIVALGGETAPSSIAGLTEVASTVSSVEEARALGERLREGFRQAAWKLDDAERKRLATVVVVGGSRQGVELAGGIADRARTLAHQFRLPGGMGRVHLVEAAERVLPNDARALGEIAAHALTRVGVELRVGSSVLRVTSEAVVLSSGERIPIGLVVRATGGKAPAFLRSAGLPVSRDGRLLVDREMRSPEHLGIYAVGSAVDLIGDDLGGERGARDFARQGEVAAENVFAEILGGLGEAVERRRYSAPTSDVVVEVGANGAVGLVRGVAVDGWRARLASRAAEIGYFEAIGGPGGLVAALSGVPRPSRLLGC